MSVGIETLELVNETLPNILIKNNFSVGGKSYKLILIKKGSHARVETILYADTRNPDATVKSTKWIFGTQLKDGSWKWNSWTSGDKIPMNINGRQVTDYATCASVQIGNSTKIGRPYWLEAFIHHPEMPEAQKPKGVYVIAFDDPQIIQACFTKINHLQRTEDSVDETQIFNYGEVLRIELHTHGLTKNDEINFKCTIDDSIVTFGKKHTIFIDDFKFNGIVTADIYIDPKWKEECNHEENNLKDLKITFSVKAKETIASERYQAQVDLKSVKIDKTRIASIRDIYAQEPKTYKFNDKVAIKNRIHREYLFKINYSGNREMIQKRNKTVSQMVSIMDTKINKPQNDHPCKYISILIKEIDSKNEKKQRKFIAFGEYGDGSVSDLTYTEYCIVSGKEKNKKVKINIGGLNTEGCVAYNFEHDKKSIFEAFKAKAKQQWIYPNDYNITTKNTIELELTYPYHIQNDNVLLKYFWPASMQPQLFFVPLQTCAYPKQGVRILVYPDLVWAISFTYGDQNPKAKAEWRKDLSAERKKILKEHAKEEKELRQFIESKLLPKKLQEQLEKLRYYQELLDKLGKINKLKLGIKASYDDKVISFDHLANKIINISYAFTLAKALMDQMVGSDVPDEIKPELINKQVNKLGKLGKFVKKLPVTITVENPKLSVGASWGYQVFYEDIVQEPTAPYEVDLFLKADPLFEASGVLDIITCCEFIPAAGQAIKVVRIVLESSGVEPVFTLTAKGSISLAAKGKIHFDNNNNASKLEVQNTNSLKFTVEASISADGGLAGFLFAGGDWDGFVTKTKYEAKAETGLELKFGLGVEAGKGLFLDAKLDFTGLIAVGKKVTESDEFMKKEKEAFRYEIIEPTPLLGDTYYFEITP
ncbi:hypothetical protein [Maribacter luteus]|uniref:hypothetical protein n=1 Tax=Maribacter luteus TaxID=2594478 RepID=UPI002493387B|nr:hypothetical protein [Maribacter luteus]